MFCLFLWGCILLYHHLLWNRMSHWDIISFCCVRGSACSSPSPVQLFGRILHGANKEEAADSLPVSRCWPKGELVTSHSCTTASTGGKNLKFIAATPTYCIVWKRNASLLNATEGCPLLPGKTFSLGLFASSQDLAHIERISLLAMIIVLKT